MDIIINIIEVFNIYFLLSHTLISKKQYLSKQLIGITTVAIFTSIFNLLNIDYNITGLFLMIIYAAFAYFCFDGSRFERLFWGSSYIIIVSISDKVAFHIIELTRYKNLSNLLEPSLDRFLACVLYLIISFLLVLFVIHGRSKHIDLPPKLELLTFVIIAVSFIALDRALDFIVSLNGSDPVLANWMHAIYIFILFFSLAIWFLTKRLAEIYKERNDLLEKQRIKDHELKEYVTLKNSMLSMRAWKHDYTNQLLIMQDLLYNEKYSELRAYIDNLCGDVKNHKYVLNTGNFVLDSILSSKIALAKQNDINLQYEVYSAEQLSICQSELTSVIGNLLDNAIEACINLKDKKHAYITLNIKPYKRMICIDVENSSDGIYNIEDNKLKSRKEEKGHGIGLMRVEQIVQHAHGFCNYYAGPDYFKYTIMLPIAAERSKHDT